MFRGPLSSPWAPSHASPGLLLFFPSFKTWILQPGHSQKVKGLNNLLPCWGREERVSGPSFSFLTPSAPPDFLHPGTDYPVCVWRDNPWQILHSKVLDFIRKSCNSLTTVHQALQHATTWPTESLWTCHLTLVFIFKNSLIFIKAILLSAQVNDGISWPHHLYRKQYYLSSLITWMNEYTHSPECSS